MRIHLPLLLPSSFIASLVDQGSYYILVRLFVYILTPPAVIDWRNLVGALSVLTIFIANIQALIERDVKRLFAMLCIADVGYNLMAITSVTPIGTQANLYFFLTGGITMALAFMCVGIFDAAGIKTINDFPRSCTTIPVNQFCINRGNAFLCRFSSNGRVLWKIFSLYSSD